MDTARMPSESLVRRIDCSLTSGLLMESILLASMVFADGTLSDQRGLSL